MEPAGDRFTPPWGAARRFSIPKSGTSVVTMKFPRSRIIRPDENRPTAQAPSASNLLEAWQRFGGDERWRLELGLARLVSSVWRDRGRFWLQDRILDVAVALEVLYGLGGGELTHKLSTRAAYLLAPSEPGRRVEIFEAVKDLYATRSGIVHGKKRTDRSKGQEAKDVAQHGYEIGRQTLLALLERGEVPRWQRVTLTAE